MASGTKPDSEHGELISKKQLLERYGFSYGALYRWKRMGLIPDEWFIKKSTVTGQETFFPAPLICERVERILEKKEGVPLEALAKELRGDAKKDNCLVIATKYGEKRFTASDIHSIRIRSENGETDLTNLILSQIKGEKS